MSGQPDVTATEAHLMAEESLSATKDRLRQNALDVIEVLEAAPALTYYNAAPGLQNVALGTIHAFVSIRREFIVFYRTEFTAVTSSFAYRDLANTDTPWDEALAGVERILAKHGLPCVDELLTAAGVP